MSKYIFSFLFTLSTILVNAQFESAMQMGTQMSLNTLQGTARYVATGGVISTVGGDISNLTTNPAGLGLFSRTELEFTPTLSINNVNSNYMYTKGSEKQQTNWNNSRVKFTVNSAGIVFANRLSDKDPLRNSNIIIGVNRIADFNRTVDFGVNENRIYSYSNYLSDVATNFKNLSGFPAPNTYPTANNYINFDNLYNRVLMSREASLTFYNNSGAYYQDPLPYNSSALRVNQFGQIKNTGGVTELSFAWAGSINDKVYIGASLGIPFLTYKSEFSMSELNYGITAATPFPQYGNYRSMELLESDYYSGTGINLKLGGMVKLTDKLKASAYFHTPTAYQITNEYAVKMTTVYQSSTQTRPQQTLAEFQFQYYTPLKAGAGLSYTFGKMGFIGAEYEFTNLNSLNIKFEDDPRSTSYVNNVLVKQNQDVHTLRLGGEFVIPTGNEDKPSPYRLRLGYNYRTSPSNKDYVEQQGDQISQTFSGGVGVRGKSVSLDFTYMKTQFRDYDYLYGYNDGNKANSFDYGVTSWNSINQVSATVNFRFNSGK
jgi:hypothetical protein